MADVTISGLTQATPGPSFLLPCSDGATTYASCISSLFANMGNKYVYVLGNSNANNTGTGMYLRNTYNGNGFTAIYFGNDGAINAGCVWQGSKNYTNYAGPSSMNIGTLYDAPMGLVTGNAVRMYVAGNGNVGIGTANPTSKLHISGDARVTGDLKVDSGYIDTTGTTVSLASNAYIDFPLASGLLIVNAHGPTDGSVSAYLVGGTGVMRLGTSVGVPRYTVTFVSPNPEPPFYRFTNTSGGTQTYGFCFMKTRPYA